MDRQETHDLFAQVCALHEQALSNGKSYAEATKAAQGRWNAWAQDLLDLQRKLKSEKRWTRARKIENNNNETRAWHQAAVARFSSAEDPWCPSEELYFSNFIFPGSVHFEGAQFGKSAFFVRSVFHGDAGFAQTRFNGRYAPFSGIQFKSNADFSQAHFVHEADFAASRFQRDVTFRSAHIGGVASFTEARFAKGLDFSDAHLGEQTIFAMARFGGDVRFDNTCFNGPAGIVGCTFTSQPSMIGARFRDQATFLMPEGWTEGAQFAIEPVFLTQDDLTPPSL